VLARSETFSKAAMGEIVFESNDVRMPKKKHQGSGKDRDEIYEDYKIDEKIIHQPLQRMKTFEELNSESDINP